MSKHNPRNKLEALTYEWGEYINRVKALAAMNQIEQAEAQLKLLKQSIANYQQSKNQSK